MLKNIETYISGREKIYDLCKLGLNLNLLVSAKESRALSVQDSLKSSFERYMEIKETQIKNEAEKLEALNPLSVLMRGFAVMTKNGTVIKKVEDIKINDDFEIKLKDGVVKGVAKEIVKN